MDFLPFHICKIMHVYSLDVAFKLFTIASIFFGICLFDSRQCQLNCFCILANLSSLLVCYTLISDIR